MSPDPRSARDEAIAAVEELLVEMLPRFVAEQTGTRDTGDLTRAQAVALLDAVLDVTAGGLTPLAVERAAAVPAGPDLAELRRLAEAARGYPMGADLAYLEALDPEVILALLDRIKELEAAAPKLEQVAWGRPNPWRPTHGGPAWRMRGFYENETPDGDWEPVYRIAAGAAGPAGDPETTP